MRRTLLTSMAIVLFAVSAHAATSAYDDGEDVDLRALRHKLVKMKREMDLLMRDIVSTSTSQDPNGSGMADDVRVDIVEQGASMIVRADLPGMDKERIDVTLENNKILKIKASRSSAKEVKAEGMMRQERSYGSFERVLELPKEGRSAGIRASYKDGVLEIVIPKKEEKEEKVKVSVQ